MSNLKLSRPGPEQLQQRAAGYVGPIPNPMRSKYAVVSIPSTDTQHATPEELYAIETRQRAANKTSLDTRSKYERPRPVLY